MGIRWVSLALDHGPASTSQRFALVALGEMADNDTGECWPAIGRIARRIGVSDRQARRLIRALEADEWLSTTISRGGRNEHGKPDTSNYRLNAERFQRAEQEPSNPDTHDRVEDDSTRTPMSALTRTPMTVNPDTHVRRTVSNHHYNQKPMVPSRSNGQVSARASEQREAEDDEREQESDELQQRPIEQFLARLAEGKKVPT